MALERRALEAHDPTDEASGPHVQILVRHGLLTHIARLAPELPDPRSAGEQFRADAARVAQNVIALPGGRFGLYLRDGVPEPISDVPHRLEAVSERAALSGSALADLTALMSAMDARLAGLEGLAPGDHIVCELERRMTERVVAPLESRLAVIESRLPAEDGARQSRVWEGMEALLRHLHTLAERIDAGTHADPILARLADMEETVALGFETAGEAREAGRQALDARLASLAAEPQAADAAIAALTARLEDGLAGIARQQPAPDALADTLAVLIAEPLEALSHRIAALDHGPDPDDFANAVAAILRPALEARTPLDAEALGHALAETMRPALEARPGTAALAEAVCAALHPRLEALVKGMPAAQDLAAALAPGLEKLEARLPDPSALADRLSAELVEQARGPDPDTLAKALAPGLQAPLAALRNDLSRGLHSTAATLAEALRRLEDGQADPAALADTIAGALAHRLDQTENRLGTRVDSAGARLEGTLGRLAAQLPPAEHVEAALAGLRHDLVAALDERLGVLRAMLEPTRADTDEEGPDLQAVQRSLRNFWLANEETLRRIGEVVKRLEAASDASDSTDPRGALRELEVLLMGIDAKLTGLERTGGRADAGAPAGELRLMLAELLAAQQRLGAETTANSSR